MKFSKKLSLKFYQFRHSNWSAPTIMGTFIVFCMMLVYVFESIGLLKSERTINYRIRTPEKVIMTNNEALNILSLNVGNKTFPVIIFLISSQVGKNFVID